MKTEKNFEKEVKQNRKKLFYKLYFIPWALLTITLFVSILYLWVENERLQKVNFNLGTKNQAKQIIVRWPEESKSFKESEKIESEEGSGEDEIISRVRKTPFDKSDSNSLLELYILKRQLDNEGIGVRTFRDDSKIQEDFAMIRSYGFTRENYRYAEELGVRVEVQLIKELENILEKELDAWDEIFVSESKKDILGRELKYKINEGVLNEFRVYWQINKK